MSSIHKQPGEPFYFCAFSTWDAEREQWRRHFRSTGTAHRKEAQEICRVWTKAAKAGHAGKLTPDTARDIIARGVADVFSAANREHLPSRSVRDWCAGWLQAKRLESAPTTVSRYEGIIHRFLDYLRSKADRDVANLTASDVGGFRDTLARNLSRYIRHRRVTCTPVDPDSAKYRCLIGDFDLAEAVLLNGGGHAARSVEKQAPARCPVYPVPDRERTPSHFPIRRSLRSFLGACG